MTATDHPGQAPAAGAAPGRAGLEVRGLAVRDGRGRAVVDRLDLVARAGEVVALTGPSGSGKTSALLGLLGALPPGLTRTAGTVTWAGAVVAPAAARRWRRATAGVVGQDPRGALDPLRGARAAVAEGLEPWRLPRAEVADRADAALASVGLDPAVIGPRRPSALSGGQVQRVVLARALVADPPLLVLDEPTSALDAAALDLVAAAVARRRAGGRVTLLVSHDAELVARLADRAVAVGPPPPSPAARPPAPAPSAAPILAARGLRLAEPGGTVLLDGGRLDLRAGEALAVLGPSGCGKTTLLRALAGLAPPAAGSLRLGGRPLAWPLAARGRDALRAVQLVGQDPAGELNPAHRAGAAVARPLRVLRGLDRAAARAETARLLAAVGLDPALAARRPAALSGGQRQRVALARALAAGPDVLLADEPTSALDAAATAAVLDLLDRLRRRGLAVLVVTHDRAVADRADRVLSLTPAGLLPALAPRRPQHAR